MKKGDAAEVLLATVMTDHAECIRDRVRWNKGETTTAPTTFTHIAEAQRKTSEVAAAKQREAEEHRKVQMAKEAIKTPKRPSIFTQNASRSRRYHALHEQSAAMPLTPKHKYGLDSAHAKTRGPKLSGT